MLVSSMPSSDFSSMTLNTGDELRRLLRRHST